MGLAARLDGVRALAACRTAGTRSFVGNHRGATAMRTVASMTRRIDRLGSVGRGLAILALVLVLCGLIAYAALRSAQRDSDFNAINIAWLTGALLCIPLATIGVILFYSAVGRAVMLGAVLVEGVVGFFGLFSVGAAFLVAAVLTTLAMSFSYSAIPVGPVTWDEKLSIF